MYGTTMHGMNNNRKEQKFMKRIWNGIKIAFSMYSKIPMPDSKWTEENMSYAMCFFPLVGVVIGGVTLGVFELWKRSVIAGVTFSPIFWIILLALIPIFITGGIHMDGFLDTMDALSSWQTKERRLEILKDSHAGAFAIISGCVYFLLSVAAYSSAGTNSIKVIALGFILSRSLSGLSVVTFPQARKKGLVATFSENAAKKTVKIVLIIYLIFLAGGMTIIGGITGLTAYIAAWLVFLYYYKMSLAKFGGVTGDLAGYFLQICELVIAFSAIIAEQIIRLV